MLSAVGGVDRPLLYAEYEFTVPRSASHHFWVRKFWYHGPFRWQFDDGPWYDCGREVCLYDRVTIGSRILNWIPLGRVDLTAGDHRLRMETLEFTTEEEARKNSFLDAFQPDLDARELADWCTAVYPREVAAGHSFDVVIRYAGILNETKIGCGLHWLRSGGGYGGYLSGAGAVAVQGDGEQRFTLHVKPRREMAEVQFVVFLTPDGKWKNKVVDVRSSRIPVNARSLAAVAGKKSPVLMDCFVLSEGTFIPQGKMKSGQRYGRAEEGWFTFEPGPDAFHDAVLDLRSLNHGESGGRGYLTARGADLVFEGDVAPTKFWGVVIGRNEIFMDRDTMDYFARRMAKCGVNMVRLHGAFHERESDDPSVITPRYLDSFDYFVAAMKRQGIYVMLNTFYGHWIKARDAYDFPGYQEGQGVPHFLFIHPRGEGLWKSWVTQLLDRENPYTGMRNAADPTVAIVQIVNEDNYFFWTFNPYKNIPGLVMHVLERRFGDWLTDKYGSIARAKQAWGRFRRIRGDDFANGRAGLGEIWLLHGEGADARSGRGRSPQRFYDQTQFMTEDLRQWLDRAQAWLKGTVGFKGLVNGGNWKSADPRVLEPLDKYANAVCDVMDRHGVALPSVCDLARFYEIRPGDAYVDTSALRDPVGTPLMDIQYTGKPHIVSEPKKTMPNAFRADWIPLIAAYSALQGTDAVMNFAASPNWLKMHRRWSLNTPVTLGQYPAAALIYRNRYLKEGPVVVHEHLQLEDLYQLKGAAMIDVSGLDEMTRAAMPAAGTKSRSRLDPMAFYVGQVVRTMTEEPGASSVSDLSQFVDREAKTVRSATGELVWDWGRGLLTVDAPCVQGVVGFLHDAGPVSLSDVTVEGRNAYGSILVVSMDGQPLARSARVLVQVMSEDRNRGWKTNPTHRELKNPTRVLDMLEITDLGSPPIVVRNFSGRVSVVFEAPGHCQLLPLAPHGYAVAAYSMEDRKRVHIEFRPDCMYYVIQRSLP